MPKRLLRMIAVVAILATNVELGSTAFGQWGTLKGRIQFQGETKALKPLIAKGGVAVCAAQDVPDESFLVDPKSDGFANVFIYLAKRPQLVHPDLEKKKQEDPNQANNQDDEVKFDRKDCRFEPHSLIVRTTQRVHLLNDDPVAGNVHTHPIKNSSNNVVLNPKDRRGVLLSPLRLPEKIPCKVSCDIHAWMSAYWLVVDHPYAAITDKEGNYEIPNLPVGDHEFIIWHETIGFLEKRFPVTIKDGLNELEPIAYANK